MSPQIKITPDIFIFKFNLWKSITNNPIFTCFLIEIYKIKKQDLTQIKSPIPNTLNSLIQNNYINWTNYNFYTQIQQSNNFQYRTFSPDKKNIKYSNIIDLENKFIKILLLQNKNTPKITCYVVNNNSYKIHAKQLIKFYLNRFKYLLICLQIKYKYNLYKLLKQRKYKTNPV